MTVIDLTQSPPHTQRRAAIKRSLVSYPSSSQVTHDSEHSSWQSAEGSDEGEDESNEDDSEDESDDKSDKDESGEDNSGFRIAAARPSSRHRRGRRSVSPTPAEATRFREHAQRRGSYQLDTARFARARALNARPAGGQKRPWTAMEIGALQMYMAKCGTGWANIKRLDDRRKYGQSFLACRSQVDLKDKARNMKYVMLKAGDKPPRSFRSISLTAAMKGTLDRIGVFYN